MEAMHYNIASFQKQDYISVEDLKKKKKKPIILKVVLY